MLIHYLLGNLFPIYYITYINIYNALPCIRSFIRKKLIFPFIALRDKCNLLLPADYTITQLEALTILCHYCLLDRNQQHVLNQPLLTASAGGSLFASGSGAHGVGQHSHAAQIFSNLVHVFMTTPIHQVKCCF